MNNFLIDLAVSTLITLLRGLIVAKGSRDGEMAKTAHFKVFLKVQSLIWGVYGDAPAFRSLVGAPPINDPNETSANV